jgi:hypothetical protein
VNVPVLNRLFDEGFALVVPDKGTADRLLRATAGALRTGRCDQDAGRTLTRRLDVLTRLTSSAFLVVVTNALGRRFWLPSNLDDSDPLAWAAAFGMATSRGVTSSTMRRLHGLARDGGLTSPSMKDAFFHEQSALGSAAYPGLRMANVTFSRMERAETAYAGAMRQDPAQLDRNVLTGEVCRVQVTGVGSCGFQGFASEPFLLREGRQYKVATVASLRHHGEEPDARFLSASLAGVGFDGARVVVELVSPSVSPTSNSGKWLAGRARAALGTGEPLYVFEQPYRGQEGPPATGRWSAPVEPVKGRWHMPMEIAFAGMPTGD